MRRKDIRDERGERSIGSDTPELQNDMVAEENSAEPHEDGYEDVITGRPDALGTGPTHSGPVQLDSYAQSTLAAAIANGPVSGEDIEQEPGVDEVEDAQTESEKSRET